MVFIEVLQIEHLKVNVLSGKEAIKYRKEHKLSKRPNGYIDIDRYFSQLKTTNEHIVYVMIYHNKSEKRMSYNVIRRHELFHAKQLASCLILENSKSNYYELEKEAYYDGLVYVKERYTIFHYLYYIINMHYVLKLLKWKFRKYK